MVYIPGFFEGIHALFMYLENILKTIFPQVREDEEFAVIEAELFCHLFNFGNKTFPSSTVYYSSLIPQ